MRKGWFRSLALVALLVALGLAGVTGAAAAQKTYMATLSNTEEVPTNASTATGRATFELSDDGQSVSYTVTVNGLDNLVMGHIHTGAKGENGPVVVDLVQPAQPGGGRKTGQVAQGTFTASQLKGPLQGQPLSVLIAAMDSGNAYVNLHTNDGKDPAGSGPGDLPAGEIRGQIMMGAMPAMPRTGAGGGQGALALSLNAALALAALSLGAGLTLELRRRTRRVS
jgi:hypothetical protein